MALLLFSTFTSTLLQTTCPTLEPNPVGFTAISTSLILMDHFSTARPRRFGLMSIYQNCTKIKISAYCYTFFTNYSLYYPYARALTKVQSDIVAVTTLTSTFAKQDKEWKKPRIWAMGVYNARDAMGNVFYTPHCPGQSCPGPRWHYQFLFGSPAPW